MFSYILKRTLAVILYLVCTSYGIWYFFTPILAWYSVSNFLLNFFGLMALNSLAILSFFLVGKSYPSTKQQLRYLRKQLRQAINDNNVEATNRLIIRINKLREISNA